MQNIIKISLLLSLVIVTPSLSQASENGLITKQSQFSVTETLNRLEKIVRKKNLIIFTRWSYTDGAKNVNMNLRDTEFLLFGNPKLGTQFFTSNQTSGLDLPMKALAWEDKTGKVWLTYNDPHYIAKRHNITNRTAVVKKMTKALNKLTNMATGNK